MPYALSIWHRYRKREHRKYGALVPISDGLLVRKKDERALQNVAQKRHEENVQTKRYDLDRNPYPEDQTSFEVMFPRMGKESRYHHPVSSVLHVKETQIFFPDGFRLHRPSGGGVR